MSRSYSRTALKQRAAAEGITAKQFDEVYQVCHDTASFELWDSSEEAQDYMAELWTRSILFSNETAYKAFDPLMHDFTEVISKLEIAAKNLPVTDETITSLMSDKDLSEKAAAIARFALSLDSVPVENRSQCFQAELNNSCCPRRLGTANDVRTLEENEQLRERVQELESRLERQTNDFEALKCYLYGGDK